MKCRSSVVAPPVLSSPSSDSELAAVRGQIDHVDSQLLQLFNERARLAQQVGKIKAAAGKTQAMYHPEREAQVLRRLGENNPGPLPNEHVTHIFREIMSACLALETPLTVAFLGPLGTFSEAAARQHFGHAVRCAPQTSIDEVFRAVAVGEAHYGVVPVENSNEGQVGRTLDLLLATPLKVCGEVVLRVQQNLLSCADELSQIRTVKAHPQSLAQCQEWLNRHLPQADRVPTGSNAEAAAEASRLGGETAAIASLACLEHYPNLHCLANAIEDEANNSTRFLVLGQRSAGVSGKDKTSLIMAAPNRTGALHELLLPFSACGLSLTHLASRPSKNALWKYVFFVDFLGHENDVPVAAALTDLSRRAAYLKILGSYPQTAL